MYVINFESKKAAHKYHKATYMFCFSYNWNVLYNEHKLFRPPNAFMLYIMHPYYFRHSLCFQNAQKIHLYKNITERLCFSLSYIRLLTLYLKDLFNSKEIIENRNPSHKLKFRLLVHHQWP